MWNTATFGLYLSEMTPLTLTALLHNARRTEVEGPDDHFRTRFEVAIDGIRDIQPSFRKLEKMS